MTARHLPPPLMVAAIRHLRTQGWRRVTIKGRRVGVLEAPSARLRVFWSDGNIVVSPLWPVGGRGEPGLKADVLSVAQAVDHLVTAGILPPEMHSLVRQFEVVDAHSHTLGVELFGVWSPVSWVADDEQPPAGWEPLYRRMVAS